MKLIRQLPLLAALFALMAAFAFRPDYKAAHGTKASYFWYQLKAGGNQNSASDYAKVGGQPSCPGGTVVCAVYAQDNGAGHPAGIPASGPVVPNSDIQTVDKRAS